MARIKGIELSDEQRRELERGQVSQPGAVIESDTATLKALAFGGWPLDAAVSVGALKTTGDKALAERFFKLFRLPEPVERAASV